MTPRWPKDLLNLIFLEIESGHDMITFSEINRGCYLVFHQNLEVIRTVDLSNDPKIFTQLKKTGQQWGLLRTWFYNGQVFQEYNFHRGKQHGLCREWWNNGNLYGCINYHYGEFHGPRNYWRYTGTIQCKLNYCRGKKHGRNQRIRFDGVVLNDNNYHYGNLIEK